MLIRLGDRSSRRLLFQGSSGQATRCLRSWKHKQSLQLILWLMLSLQPSSASFFPPHDQRASLYPVKSSFALQSVTKEVAVIPAPKGPPGKSGNEVRAVPEEELDTELDEDIGNGTTPKICPIECYCKKESRLLCQNVNLMIKFPVLPRERSDKVTEIIIERQMNLTTLDRESLKAYPFVEKL